MATTFPPNGEGRPEGRPTHKPGTHQAVATVARDRVRAMLARRRVCAELEQLAPLVTYYRGRPLRAVPLAQLLGEGWWAA